MESGNGVHVEEPIVEELNLSVIDQNGDVNGEKVVDSNVISKNVLKSGGLKGSKTKSGGAKGSKTDVGNGVSKPSEESAAATTEGNSKTKRVIKEQANGKGLASSLRNQKAGICQSLSFPSKVAHGAMLKKSIDASALKSSSKQSISKGKKSDAPSETSLTPDSVLDNSNGKTSSEVTSKLTVPKKIKASVKQSSSTPVQSTKHSVSTKPASKSADAPTLDVSPIVEPCSKPVQEALSSEVVDEAQAPNDNEDNSAMRKSIASGFAFRLDERAEKRKEFNMKIEEKIHAKEAEKNNIQAKSKECQEAEIKQLRKSLNFKAAPMPTFYKEPPPKVELKKIPITRPKSPKLGRSKSSANGTASPTEGGAPSVSPRVSVLQKKTSAGDKSADATRKSVTKSQSKLHQPRETVGSKSAEKNVKSKPKKEEVEAEKEKAGSEIDSASHTSVKGAEATVQVSAIDVPTDNGVIANTPNTEAIAASQIMVGG